MDAVFYWIGIVVVGLAATVAILGALLWLYLTIFHGRFEAILFRKGERRISIASWYNAKLMNDEYWCADDWPVCERPFHLSYRLGERRLFLLLGTLGPHRHSVIKGMHPEVKP